MIKTVIKANGKEVPFDSEKLNKKSRWAADRQVNWSDISLKVYKRLDDKCKTTDINKALIDVCVEAFDEKHFMLAGRVLAGVLYKEAFGGYSNIPTLKEHHDNMVSQGYWEDLPYSEDEFEDLNNFMDHGKDLKSSYPEIKQIADKYVIRNRVEDKALESPQFTYMGMAMANMKAMPKDRRINDVKKLYTYLSDKKICAPTPFMTKLRTPDRGFASCFTSDTQVNTYRGLVDIVDVMVGDKVLSHKGSWRAVKGLTYRDYEGELYTFNVSTKPNNTVWNTDNHQYVVLRDGVESWVEAKDVIVGDYLKNPIPEPEISYESSIWDIISGDPRLTEYVSVDGLIGKLKSDNTFSERIKTTVDSEILKSPDFYRMLGYYLGDGHVCFQDNGIRNSGQVGFTFNCKEVEYVEDVLNTFTNLFGEGSIKVHDDSAKDSCIRLLSQRLPLAVLFETLCSKGSFGKRDAKGVLLNAPEECMEQVLVGYIRSDGCSSSNGYRTSSVSKELSETIAKLSISLGYPASVSSHSRKKESGSFADGVDYCVTMAITQKDKFSEIIGKNLGMLKTGSGKKKIRYSYREGDVIYTKVHSVKTKPYKGLVYDITVDVDESFTVEGLAVHNCAVYTTHDTANSLASGDHIAYMMTCHSSGIGSHIKTRSKGDGVRGGTTIHQGKRPYYKMVESSVAANLQSSRGGSATVHVNVLDPEINEIITWKSKKTAITVRVDGIHYSIGYNRLFAQKVKDGEDWMLVSYADNPDLYEAMYEGDQSKFEKLYYEHEANNPNVKKVDARKLAVNILIQSQESGQVYLHRTDELNRNTPFKDKIYSSNL